jgi:RNA polymerase sigma factor (sigma-70 family)
LNSQVEASQQPHGRPGREAAAARTEVLFAEYGRTVSGLCRALLRDRADAEDAAQQTFLSAHRALGRGTAPRDPAAWLATIARNECWSRIRARMREPLPAAEVEGVSTANDPLAEAIRRADLRALWAAIEELPPQQRDALLLREFGGLTYAELAAALAVSGSAVESLLFRARDGLRGKLRAAYGAATGASWIEAIIRLAAGGGAPVAAKVAVLGLGAAAVGSGAVVVPHVYDNHHPSHGPPPRTAAVVVHRQAPAPVPVRARVPVSHVVWTHALKGHPLAARKHDSREQQARYIAPRHVSGHSAGRKGDEGRKADVKHSRGGGPKHGHESGGNGKPGKRKGQQPAGDFTQGGEISPGRG